MSRRAEDVLKLTGTPYARDVNIASLSTLGIGAVAAYVAYPESTDGLVELLTQLIGHGISHRVVGGMSNIMPRREKYDGVLIITRKIKEKSVAENVVTAECGAMLPTLVSFAAANSLGGIEQLFHIPGSLGGSVRGNAGAHGLELSDVLVDATVFDPTNCEVRALKRDELDPSYRSSRLKREGLILLSARLELNRMCNESIRDGIEKYRKLRLSQPKGGSLGSTFKRVNGVSAGYYIDRAGLKGFRIGGAYVSGVHAGFLMNDGSATVNDYLRLINEVRTRVYREFGIVLEEEIDYL